MGRQAKSAATAARASDFFVVRERLFDRLDELRARAVWLQGPTGAGKTVLLRLYTRRARSAVLWLAIDAASTTPDSLCDALLEAAQRSRIGDLPQFAGEHRQAPIHWLQLCVDRIAQSRSRAVLVIDDAQRLLPALAPLLAALIDACAQRVRLLFAAQDLPLGLEAQLAAGRLVVIGHEQLAFDETEALALARQVGAARELAVPLRARTSGWAAGLMLALQLAQGATLANAQRRLDVPLASLVNDGVLAGMPGPTLAALAALAPARLIPLALRARGEPWSDAVEQLQRLGERGLFVERVGDDLRLHDLLRNALLQQPLGDTERDAAIQALSAAERPELALACLAAAPACAAALCNWLHDHGTALLQRADIGALAALVLGVNGELPAAVLLWCARGALATDLALADTTAERAYTGFSLPRDAASLRHCCAVGLLAQLLLLDGKRLELWQKRLAGLPAASAQDVDNEPLLETSARLIEHVLQTGRPNTPEIHAVHERQHEALQQPQPPQEAILAASFLIYALLMLQRRELIPAAICQFESTRWFHAAPLFAQINWHIDKGFTLVGLGRLEDAAAAFATAAELARQQATTELLRSALAGRARTLLLIGALEDARAAISEAEALPGDPGVHRRVDHLKLAAWLELARGRPARALTSIDTAERLLADAGLPPTATLQIDRAQVLFALGRHDDAIALAAQTAQGTDGTVRDVAECTHQLLRAHLLWPQDPAQATNALRAAVALIEQRHWTNFLSLLPHEAGIAAHRALQLGPSLHIVRDSIRERRLPAPPDAGALWPWPLRVFVLGHWRLERYEEIVSFHGKVQRKPLELLKFLACAREQAADHAALCAALWPDADDHAARRSLEMAVARLREMLGEAGWVRVADGRVRLERTAVWCDAQALWRACADAEQAGHADDAARARAAGEALLALYRGPALTGEDETPWVLGVREKLRSAVVRAVRAVAGALQAHEQHALAIALLEKALAAEPLAEELAQRLMQAQIEIGHPAEAMRVYRQLRQMLSVLLGTQPSAATEQLRQSIVHSHQQRSAS